MQACSYDRVRLEMRVNQHSTEGQLCHRADCLVEMAERLKGEQPRDSGRRGLPRMAGLKSLLYLASRRSLLTIEGFAGTPPPPGPLHLITGAEVLGTRYKSQSTCCQGVLMSVYLLSGHPCVSLGCSFLTRVKHGGVHL